MTARSGVCKRALEWASLRLDGELSELERRLLEGHLVECASCRAAADGFAAFTAELRRAELEPLGRPVALPERRLPLRPIQVAAAAALVLAAAGVGSLASGIGSHQHVVRPRVTAPTPALIVASADNIAGLPRYADDIKRRPQFQPGLYRPGASADL
jgi:ferric-dicitrate binding protein FerR (iron transport regulator)